MFFFSQKSIHINGFGTLNEKTTLDLYIFSVEAKEDFIHAYEHFVDNTLAQNVLRVEASNQCIRMYPFICMDDPE